MTAAMLDPELDPAAPPSTVARPNFLTRLLNGIMPRRLTPEEQAEERARKKLEEDALALRRKLETEADAAAWEITETLADLGICYKYKKSEKDEFSPRIKKVKFRKPFFLSEEALYLPVDLRPGYRPHGIGIEHLSNDDVLKNLSGNVGRKVDCQFSEDTGLVYVVWRLQGSRAIPTHVKYDDAIALRPASADSLSLPLGMTTGKRLLYRSLGQMVSMLVAGTTGGGKSNFLRVAITTLINHNSPRRLKIGLIDLKRGVEFAPFADLPHLLHFSNEGESVPALIDRREDIIPFLSWVVKEGERRLDLLKENHVVKIGQYNTKNPHNPLPHIVIVIDEWADIRLEPKLGAVAQELIINVASRFRAAGVGVIVCTQYPKSQVIDMRLKAVLPAILAFSLPNIAASVMVLGSDDAFKMPNINGRGIFQYGRDIHEIQVPFINNDTVEEIVAKAKGGEKYKAELNSKHDVTIEEIFEWAVTANNGRLAYADVYGHFSPRGFTAREAKKLGGEWADKTVLVGSSSYRVARPTHPRDCYRLLPVEDDRGDETQATITMDEIYKPEDFKEEVPADEEAEE